MAALRFAARKLGGQRLQAPVAVVEEAQRRLFHDRSMSTSSAAAYTPPTSNGGLSVDERESLARRLMAMWLPTQRLLHTRPATIDEKKDAAIRLGQIDEKKDELYNLIADLERKYKVPGRIGRQNGRLLEQLSVQVRPRPNDPHWRSCRRAQRSTRVLMFVGAFSIGHMIPIGLHWLITEADPNPKKIALDWWNKQKQ